jgi:hypothetical protein
VCDIFRPGGGWYLKLSFITYSSAPILQKKVFFQTAVLRLLPGHSTAVIQKMPYAPIAALTILKSSSQKGVSEVTA